MRSPPGRGGSAPPRRLRRGDERSTPRRRSAAGATVDLAQVARRPASTTCSTSSTASWSGSAPVKTRIREIAALLRRRPPARARFGIADRPPDLHMSLHRQPGHGQDHGRAADGRDPPPARLHRAAAISSRSPATTWSASTSGTRRRRPRRCSSGRMGGVLFIDEAYYLHRPENERDYGQEAIEILLQVMEDERDDLVVVLAGYADRMDDVLPLQPGHELAGRAPHRLPRLHGRGADGSVMMTRPRLPSRPSAEDLPRVPRAPHRATAVRERAQHPQRHRPRPPAPGAPAARRSRSRVGRAALTTLEAADFSASRVFAGGAAPAARERDAAAPAPAPLSPADPVRRPARAPSASGTAAEYPGPPR